MEAVRWRRALAWLAKHLSAYGLLVGYLVVLRVGAARSFSEGGDVGRPEWQLFWAAILVGYAALAVYTTGFWRRWNFFGQELDNPGEIIVGTIVALAALTEAFAVVTALLTQQEWLTTTGKVGNALYWASEAQYLWNFADAIPSLEIPKTLNWPELSHPFKGYASGVMLLTYKILAIIPVVGILVKLFEKKPAA